MFNINPLFSIATPVEFQNCALTVFEYQFHNNSVYQQFCKLLDKSPRNVNKLEQIPFLPIQFFKSHSVVTSTKEPEIIFTSSGTTGSTTSRHLVINSSVYETSFRKGFAHFYGDIENYAILALLPSYLEREGSSLIYMVQDLIKSSNNPHSGFYLNDYEGFRDKLEQLERQNKKTLVIGVSFALLDVVERFSFNLKNSIIMETGGMKGRRKEMIRQELHQRLAKGFGVENIHSEYGMTELLSQAYSYGDGTFDCPSWMKVLIRDPEDPFELLPKGKTGGINVIDLANIHSCSFIATQDLGKTLNNGQIEVMGRFDNSDIRGCNLMVL